MDLAADAVLDVIAPPARPAPARASDAANDQASFDDHLAAAAQDERADNETTGRPTEGKPIESATESADDQRGGDVMPAALPVTPAQPAAPIVVHLIAETPLPAQHGETAQPTPANAAPIEAPCGPAPAPAPTTPQAALPLAPVQTAPTTKQKSEKSAAPAEKSAAPTAQPAQVMASASQAQAAPQQASASTTAAAAPAVDAELSLAAAAAPVPAQGAPEAPARQPKAAKLQGDVKAEAAPAADHTETPAPNSAPRLAPKSAAPQSAPKEAIAVAPSDARESAPPSQPATSAPAPAASTHTQHAAAEQIAARAAPAAQVAREIVRRFDGGNTRFELRLDPPELGRVEVRLDVSRDHRVTAVIAADSPQALTELARHARDLEQMLQSAGLELSDSGLSFDLRQGGERAETAEFSAGSSDGAPLMEEATQVAARPLGYERWRGVRVDMMV